MKKKYHLYEQDLNIPTKYSFIRKLDLISNIIKNCFNVIKQMSNYNIFFMWNINSDVMLKAVIQNLCTTLTPNLKPFVLVPKLNKGVIAIQ